MENGVNDNVVSISDYIEKAGDIAKKQYMQKVWEMTKENIFHELMRVHAKSAELLMAAEAEILHLKKLLEPEDGDAVH
jgi:predicted kinase